MARGDITSAVREIAAERGVHECTVWRWLAAMRASGSTQLPTQERRCDYCDDPLPPGVTISRRFCDDVCRVYYHRHQELVTTAGADDIV